MTVLLDDERALEYIDAFFGKSDPGQMLSHLFVAREVVNGLGLPELQSSVYAIDAAGSACETEDFILQVILTAGIDPKAQGEIVFAAMFLELTVVETEEFDARAKVLRSRGRLEEHEKAIEKTYLYAAARDGRRWAGWYYITGPKAGTKDGPRKYVFSGLADDEFGTFPRAVRSIVGLTW